MYGLTDLFLTIWLIMVYCLVSCLGFEILMYLFFGGEKKMNYGNRDGIKKVINFIRCSKITEFYVLVDLLIDSDNDDMLDIIVDNIDFFELYFEDLD